MGVRLSRRYHDGPIGMAVGRGSSRIHGWYQKNARERSWPVGQKRPNDFGMFDMHGNTWDWCQESTLDYKPGVSGYALDEEDIGDITGRLDRVVRGGSFNYQAHAWRSARRNDNRPSNRSSSVGLRVARTL